MSALEYAAPGEVAEAVRTVAAAPGSAYLAGGTNLVDLLKLGVSVPSGLVDVTHLGLDAITPTPEGGLRIGATVRNADLAADATVRERYPVLSQALLAGASGQLRNLATTGGNLLQRTRCRYFTDPTKSCNKHAPGTGCPAREGDHHNLAILGHSPACVATRPSDMAVALVALDAVVHVTGPQGDRAIPVEQLHRLPGDDPSRDTVLEHGDLIVAVELPALALAATSTYRKARERTSFAFALGSVAAALEVVGGEVADVRLAWGAVAHKPWRARAAEAALLGRPATQASFRAAAGAELEAAEPLRDNAYKVELLGNLTAAVLVELSA